MRFRERLFPFSWNATAIFLLAMVAIVPAGLMWHWVSTSWVPLPFWDEWHTPGSQFESWKRGTLTLAEMFSQHNESRLFFSRLLYFSLEQFGGWDVRKEIRVVFLGVCALCLLLLHLLRRTPGATPISTLLGWTLITWTCFAPVQVENFLYGIEIETFFPGFAILAAAAVNLSRLSFRAKTLLNITLAFVATYTFANGMLVWALAWPLPSPNECESRPRRWRWLALYLRDWRDLGRLLLHWISSALLSPAVRFAERAFLGPPPLHRSLERKLFRVGFSGSVRARNCALILYLSATGYAVWRCWRRDDWRTFYPWLLLEHSPAPR